MSLGATIVVFSGLFTSRALIDPPPLQISPPRDPLQLLAAVGNAASAAGWRIQVRDHDSIRAVFDSGRHSAEVELKLRTESIALTYINSKELDYSDDGGRKEIHKAYLSWTGTLMSSIKRALASMCTDLGWVQKEPSMGSSNQSLVDLSAFLASPEKTRVVVSSSGQPTGYVVREYSSVPSQWTYRGLWAGLSGFLRRLTHLADEG